MSHVVTIQTQVRDPEAVRLACARLRLPEPVLRTVQLFAASATGWAVELPGWRFPVVCELAAGQLQYDNFSGSWGDPRQLDHFLQAYAIEKAKLEARRKGYTVWEQPLEGGSVKLTIQVTGGAA